MGVSTVAAHFLLFIVTVTLVMSIVDSMVNYVDDMNASLRQKVNLVSRRIETDIEIISVDYSSPTLTIYIQNTGDTTIEHNKTDLYLDGQRLDRSLVNKTLESDTDVYNPGFFDASEVLKVNYTEVLSGGGHYLIFSTPEGVKDQESFSVS